MTEYFFLKKVVKKLVKRVKNICPGSSLIFRLTHRRMFWGRGGGVADNILIVKNYLQHLNTTHVTKKVLQIIVSMRDG